MFSYQAKYSLPKGFNVQAGLTSLFISNRIYLGPCWNYKINDNYIGRRLAGCMELRRPESIWICNYINRMGTTTFHHRLGMHLQKRRLSKGRSLLDKCFLSE